MVEGWVKGPLDDPYPGVSSAIRFPGFVGYSKVSVGLFSIVIPKSESDEVDNGTWDSEPYLNSGRSHVSISSRSSDSTWLSL
jgi:hypothetical protein